MPGSPFTGQGGQFGGPQYGWGGEARSANSGQNRGRYTSSPEAGLHRGEWQWRGHGPSAQRSYGWDYQGGAGRDEITQRSEARMGSPFQARMAQERSGGLPRGNYAVDYDDLGERAGRGRRDVNYDWGWQGRGGMQGGGMQRGEPAQRYGGDYRGGGYGRGGQGYGRDYGPRGGQPGGHGGGLQRGYGVGMRAGGGYGRDFGAYGGQPGGQGGGLRPLDDADFYRRVERW